MFSLDTNCAETTDLKAVEVAMGKACHGYRHGLIGQEAKGTSIDPYSNRVIR